jgi:hypothetical protein
LERGNPADPPTTTGTEGTFVFPDLLAGTDDVTVTLQGFKTAEHSGIGLASTDRLTLRATVLEVGGLKDTVTVTRPRSSKRRTGPAPRRSPATTSRTSRSRGVT